MLAPVLDQPERDGGLLRADGMGERRVLPVIAFLEHCSVGQHVLLHRLEVIVLNATEDEVPDHAVEASSRPADETWCIWKRIQTS